MFKFIRTLLALAHLISQREAAKQVLKQKAYKAKQARQATALRKSADAAQVAADALSLRACQARAQSNLGSNAINEAEREARYLAQSLANYAPVKQ